MIDPDGGTVPQTLGIVPDEVSAAALLAALDLGSNSFHMKVARVIDDEIQVVDRPREMLRLAAGLDENHRS